MRKKRKRKEKEKKKIKKLRVKKKLKRIIEGNITENKFGKLYLYSVS